jgi:hypothetical protein
VKYISPNYEPKGLSPDGKTHTVDISRFKRLLSLQYAMSKPTAEPIVLQPCPDGFIVHSAKSRRQFMVHGHAFSLLCKDGNRVWLANAPSSGVRNGTWIGNIDLIDMVARFDKRLDNSAARINATLFIKQWKNAHGGHFAEEAIEPTRVATASDEPGAPVSSEDAVHETYTYSYNPMANWARVHDLQTGNIK